MKPIFAIHALCQKVVLDLLVVLVRSEVAVTVDIVKGLVVLVGDVFIVFLRFKLTAKRELRIATVASKGCFAV